MKKNQTLLVASFNPGKVKEIKEFLSSFPFQIVGLEALSHVKPCLESGSTFEENARRKAEYYSRRSPFLTIADDSGLVVDALNGQPGIYSARFVSESATDEERYREVLFRMRSVPKKERSARFMCCIALADKGKVLRVFDGVVEGVIVNQAKGENGFGYDPIFLIPETGKTMAQLTPIEKLYLSHRGRALQKLVAALSEQDQPSLLAKPPTTGF